MNEIRTNIGSVAEIKVLNLYNPYKEDVEDAKNHSIADKYILQINEVIQNTTDRKYNVMDVYGSFTGEFIEGSGDWKVCTYTHFCKDTRDPHPTDEGHRVIAGLHH
jgi:hypothetical protein